MARGLHSTTRPLLGSGRVVGAGPVALEERLHELDDLAQVPDQIGELLL